ncbi:hypothetical protein MMC20_000162 [Loxospora ochrophaea]|nr:hypothetical protein [Loxospora ochrophaea]
MEKALGRFRHKPNISRNDYAAPDLELSKSPSQTESQSQSQRQSRRRSIYNHNGHKVTRGIHPDGESGRFGIHPWHFLRICFRSTCKASMAVNVLWPFVLPAIVLHFVRPDLGLWIFILNYIAMVPTANLIGFAGQELARKLPKVLGVLLETFLGSIVEIVLFMVLLHLNQADGKDPDKNIRVIQAAIIGSILANLLLCLGLCFFVGGLRRDEQSFDEAISEVGNGLLLVAAFGLIIPRTYLSALNSIPDLTQEQLDIIPAHVLSISRATALILLAAFLIYVFFQMRTHHSIFDEVLTGDEEKDEDRHKDLKKAKLTFTECIVALGIALTCVSMHAVFLVQQIDYIVERGVSDFFLGLILVPLVEKFAEHLSAIDEAYDNQMNYALAHILGASVQTALLNSPLVVIVGWAIGKNMDLNFEIFMVVLLILAIVVVGNFLKDGKSNYLEGALCVLVYLIIAVTTWYYPNAPDTEEGIPGLSSNATSNATSVADEERLQYARTLGFM